MTAQVIEAFGAHDGMSVRQALDVAQQAGLDECLILGHDEGGDIVVLSSGMEARDALWLLEQAKLSLFLDRDE